MTWKLQGRLSDWGKAVVRKHNYESRATTLAQTDLGAMVRLTHRRFADDTGSPKVLLDLQGTRGRLFSNRLCKGTSNGLKLTYGPASRIIGRAMLRRRLRSTNMLGLGARRNYPSGPSNLGVRVFPVAVRPKSSPEDRLPPRKQYCVT